MGSVSSLHDFDNALCRQDLAYLNETIDGAASSWKCSGSWSFDGRVVESTMMVSIFNYRPVLLQPSHLI